MAAPRRNAQPQPTPSWAPGFFTTLGILAAVVGLYLGYPAVVATWLFTLIGSWAATPPQLTGKDPATKYPAPASPGEAAKLARYRFWSDLKWRLTFPIDIAAPGWPVLASWAFGVWAAIAVWCLPHVDIPHLATGHQVALLGRVSDALFALVLIVQVAASRRRTGDGSPGVRFSPQSVQQGIQDAVSQQQAGKRPLLIAVAVGSVVAVLAAVVAWRLLPAPPVPLVGDWVWLPIGAVGGFGLAVFPWWQRFSLYHHRLVVSARSEWEPRWEIMKQAPAPRLLDRTFCGGATIDLFEAAPQYGTDFYFAPQNVQKIGVTVGAGVRIATLAVPSTNQQGQEVPGTKHPARFRIVTWPDGVLPSVLDPAMTAEVAELVFATAHVWACDETGVGRWLLDSVETIAQTASPTVEPAEATEADDVDQDPEDDGSMPPPIPLPEGLDDPAEQEDHVEVSETQAWRIMWHQADGLRYKDVQKWIAGAMSAHLGADFMADASFGGGQGCTYAGDLVSGNTVFAEESGVTQDTITLITRTNEWIDRWAAVLKQDVNPPTIQHPTYREGQVGQATIKRQAFTTLSGVNPEEFFGLESKLAATLQAAPFVAVTGWPGDGQRLGERHANGFIVYWSNQPMPANPDNLPPSRGRGNRDDPSFWVLAGRMNEAFRAARLAQPEVGEVRCLTTPRSRGHIWRITVRLYGGTTLADVRGAQQRLRQALGSEWLRIDEAKDGVVIVAGANPARVSVANPKIDEYLDHLDWQQAMLDSKVTGVGGITPNLIGSDRLPNNDQVKVLDFTLPTGLAFVDVKAKSKALETSSRNAFVEVRRHPSGEADKFRILASEVNPMPERAAFDYDAAETGDHKIPFSTNLFGEPTSYDNRLDPMLLVVGAAGGGKSVALQNLIYGAVLRDWDLWIADPAKGGVDFQFSEPYARAFGRTIWETKGMIAAIYEEVMRRKAINAQYNCGNYRDLPDEVRYNHTLIVLDEFTSMMIPEPVPKAMDDSVETLQAVEAAKALNAARSYVGTYVGKIVREARSTGFTMLLATQALKADTLAKIPNSSDLKDNMSRMIMGRASFGQLMAALKMPTEAPEQPDALPPGRGLYEGNGRTAEAVQVWFEASQSEFASHLSEYRQPLPPERRLDLSVFVEPEPEFEGSLVEDIAIPSPTYAATPEPVVFDLDEIEFSLDDLDSVQSDQSVDSPEAGDLVWPGDPFAANLETENPRNLEWPVGTSHDAAPPVGPAIAASRPDEDHEDLQMVTEHVLWDEINPEDWLPGGGSSRYGWDEVDAIEAFLAEFPVVRTVTWLDPHLDDEDDMGVTFGEIVSDLLAARGVSLVREAASTDQNVVPATSSGSSSAAGSSHIEDDSDPFGPLPKVPAHLLPDDNPFE